MSPRGIVPSGSLCTATLSATVPDRASCTFTPSAAGSLSVTATYGGTAGYAAFVAKYAFERLAGLPVDVEIASEFRYREPALTPGSLAIDGSPITPVAESTTW